MFVANVLFVFYGSLEPYYNLIFQYSTSRAPVTGSSSPVDRLLNWHFIAKITIQGEYWKNWIPEQKIVQRIC